MKSKSETHSTEKSTSTKPQVDKFKDLARELETDESEEAFDRTLRKVATSKPATKKGAVDGN